MEKKYHYFYKITNSINCHFYYGIHSTDDLNDGYMGSGKRLHYAYKKYGIENFTKEILKFFETRKEASNYECEIVTEELVKNEECYNCILGGEDISTMGKVIVFDNKTNSYTTIDAKVYNDNKEKYSTPVSGLVSVKVKGTDKFTLIDRNEYLLNSGKYETATSGMVTVKDKYGNIFSVSVGDEKYVNGELIPIWVGRHHSEKTREKMSMVHKINHHQKGEKNSQYGTCWITKDGENKKIKKEELDSFILNGWVKGRKIKL